MTSPSTQPALLRRLTTSDAVVIGLGSMIGAGVFAAFGPAAKIAGNGLIIGLFIAAFIAWCNAIASAQLAAAYPSSGGTYHFGRERLNEWWGFVAGWGFVIGKTASCTAMALTVANYAAPDANRWTQRAIAVGVVLILTAFNYRGITKTAALAKILVTFTLLALAIGIIAILVFGNNDASSLTTGNSWTKGGLYGTLQSAGLLFFAFAGYARIATLGEEVQNPKITIPRAIPLALGIVVVLYLVVGITLLTGAGSKAIGTSTAPFVTALDSAGVGEFKTIIQIGAVLAASGSLLALIAGIGRTSLAMARNGDLPRWLSAVHPTWRVPHHAEMALACVVSVIVLAVDLRGAIGFSSFGVLIYYSIANASAFTQTGSDRRWPRIFNVLGLIGCLTLVTTLPIQAVIIGITVFAIGIIGRWIILSRR